MLSFLHGSMGVVGHAGLGRASPYLTLLSLIPIYCSPHL